MQNQHTIPGSSKRHKDNSSFNLSLENTAHSRYTHGYTYVILLELLWPHTGKTFAWIYDKSTEISPSYQALCNNPMGASEFGAVLTMKVCSDTR